MTGRILCGLALSAGVVCAGTNELDVAREALRDGLWEVARIHAARVSDDAARLVVLESHARESDWSGLLSAFDAMGYPQGEGFAYYRALAFYNVGSLDAASNALAGVTFAHSDFRRSAARLRAELALARHEPDAALSILEADGGDDVETKLLLASIRSSRGDAKASESLWKEVLETTNASERARVTAASGLCDAAALRALVATVSSSELRRVATLRLGVILIGDSATFDEGERLIREAVRDKPDSEGAHRAFLALAEAFLGRGEFERSVRIYDDALQIWPEAARDASLFFGKGWALTKQGRNEDALAAFRQAEVLSADAESKAEAAVKHADVLAALGRETEATAAYRRVGTDYPGTRAAGRVIDVVRLRGLEEKGRAFYREFKFDEACKVFESLAAEDSSRHDRLSFYCVLCAYGAGDDDTAERRARALLVDAKDLAVRADATLWLAKYEFNRSRWREASAGFLSFVELMPRAAEAPQALVWASRASLAENDFQGVIAIVARLVSSYPDSPARATGMLAQGDALIELARFDEAVLVLDRAALVPGVSDEDRLNARVMRADALFAMGADNPARYHAALDAYTAIRTGEVLTPGMELSVSFKIARTLEKLKRPDEAVDTYYTQVVLAYRTGRLAGIRYDDAARATFARAAFRLADEYEARGRIRQAMHVLDLVRTSDVRAAGEAANRIDKMSKKGLLP